MPGYSVSVYERDRSPFWWARCYFEGEGGRDRRWSTGVRIDGEGGRRVTERLAQRSAEEEAKRRIAESTRETGPAGNAALGKVSERMLAQKIADGRRDRAVESLGWQLEKYALPFFGKTRDVRSIRRTDLEAFKRHMRGKVASGRSVNNALTALRQVLKYAWKIDELMESVPEVANVHVSNEPRGRALTGDEVQALIDSVDPRAIEARQWLIFLANTGLRKAEALAMRWGWIDWEERVLRVPPEYRKGGRSQLAPTPLNETALGVLRDRLANGIKRTNKSGKRKLPTGPNDRVFLQQKHDGARNSAADRAGLGRVRNHDLRYTAGSRAFAAGASLPEVRDFLGHTTLAMVNNYARTYAGRLRGVADSINIGVRDSVPGEEKKNAPNCTNNADQRTDEKRGNKAK